MGMSGQLVCWPLYLSQRWIGHRAGSGAVEKRIYDKKRIMTVRTLAEM
jgi:hypothetical protein